ncbi:nucleoporin SEH1-like [Oncorhynchus keta]|uniref:nucleoporin SEH1-like n=1 Tax=Oncorhynchus keta TaxID=8018 RepID=UPI00227C0057|nr:nucleoporin SEH1-like [Oncorhynchus keta]
MDNWKCTGILKGDGSPVNGSSGQPGAMNTMVGSTVQTSQNALNGSAAGRYFFPPLDAPRAGSRYGHLLPPFSDRAL